MDCSTLGFPVHYQLEEFIQIHVHWVSDTIQPSHCLSSPSAPTFNLSQHQGLFWSKYQNFLIRKRGRTESDTTEATQQQQQHCEPICTCSVAKSCLTLWSHGLQHARLPCPSLSPRVCSNSCPLSWWCHPTISSSVIPFFSSPQYFPAWVFSNKSALQIR